MPKHGQHPVSLLAVRILKTDSACSGMLLNCCKFMHMWQKALIVSLDSRQAGDAHRPVFASAYSTHFAAGVIPGYKEDIVGINCPLWNSKVVIVPAADSRFRHGLKEPSQPITRLCGMERRKGSIQVNFPNSLRGQARCLDAEAVAHQHQRNCKISCLRGISGRGIRESHRVP